MSLRMAVLIGMASYLSTSAWTPRASDIEHRVVTQCTWDGQMFSLKDQGDTFVGEHDGVSLHAKFAKSIDVEGAVFSFLRGNRVLLNKTIPDFSNPNGWISVSTDQRSFAINSSNGGAEGGWSVSIFQVGTDGTVHDRSNAMENVTKDFSSRHNCKARGDNYESLRWLTPDQLLLVASVYGTSDCGAEMGYAEGFLLEASTGKILKHYSDADLLHQPGNCTMNLNQPRKPR